MKIPQIHHFGSLSDKGSFIVMEYLNFGGSYSQADLGNALAEMHKAEPAVSWSDLDPPTSFHQTGCANSPTCCTHLRSMIQCTLTTCRPDACWSCYLTLAILLPLVIQCVA